METKQCSSCNKIKTIDNFSIRKHRNNSINNVCKQCLNEKCKDKQKTKDGLIAVIYSTQLASSRVRGHDKPEWNLDELRSWLCNDWLFDMLYNNWKNTGYKKDLKPSIDRIDDDVGYKYSNVRLVTWFDNRHNQYKGVYKIIKSVKQYDLCGKFIKKYDSITLAAKLTNSIIGKISSCCKYQRDTHNNFIWRYSEDTKKQIIINKNNKAIKVYKDNIFIGEYYNAKVVAEKLSIKRGTVSAYVSSGKSIKGYTFEYF